MRIVKKFKIAYFIGLLTLALSISITFAAFIFNQTATVTANLGRVAVSSKSFYKYNAYSTEQTDIKKNKLRNDTAYVIDSITIDYVDGYSKTEDAFVLTAKKYFAIDTFAAVANNATFDQNKNYYSFSDNKYTKLELTVDTFEPSTNTYYSTSGDFKKAKLSTGFENDTAYYTMSGSGTQADPYKYTLVSSAYNSSTTYYILLKDDDTQVGNSAVGLYEYSKSYNDIKTCKAYVVNNKDLNEKDVYINNNSISIKNSKGSNNVQSETTLITLNCTLDTENGIVRSVSLANYGNNDYRATIDYNGLGISVLDNEITNSQTGYEIAVDSEDPTKVLDSIICSASENKYNSEGKIYLSQLGLHFEFQTEIAAYIRIHIQDAWIRTRKFSATNIRQQYIMKDQIEGKSPFAVNDDEWYFDEKENCIYLKNKYVPIQNIDGTYPTMEYTFNINEGYYYDVLKSISYTDYIDVQVSFIVDIVQANRAYALWGFDPSERDYIEG